jgi:hypothetical protein
MAERYARIPARAAAISALAGRDLRVLIAIAAHADGTGRAYPSMATIAAMTGIGRGDVPRSIRRLERHRLLWRESRAGTSAVNVYTVNFDGAEAYAVPVDGVSNGVDQVSADLLTEVSAASLTRCQQIRTAGVSRFADQTESNIPKNTYTLGKPSADFASEFENFWRAYPSRGGHSNPKAPAKDKFVAAVRHGIDPSMIIGAAEKYAEFIARSGTIGKHVAQATTWLGQKRWEQYSTSEEPEMPRAGMI